MVYVCGLLGVQAVEDDAGRARSKRSYDNYRDVVHQWKPGDWGECVGHCNYGRPAILQWLHSSSVTF